MINITAIVTLYKPQKNHFDNIVLLGAICQNVICVDNTPGGCGLFFENSNILIYSDGINKGLGAALNLGLNRAYELNSSVVILCDQDTIFTSDVVALLAEAVITLPELSVISPALITSDEDIAVNSSISIFISESKLATSGMVFRLPRKSSLHKFNEKIFLDFVDWTWCWEGAKKGWKFYSLANIRVSHQLGNGKYQILGLGLCHVPSAFRHYFQFRDTFQLLSLNYVPIADKISLFLKLIIKIIFYPLILPEGLQRLRWMICGVRDGILGVEGAGAAYDTICKGEF